MTDRARDVDGRLVAAQHFARTAEATGIDAPEIVAAFDAAMSALLREAVPWASAVMTGAAGA